MGEMRCCGVTMKHEDGKVEDPNAEGWLFDEVHGLGEDPRLQEDLVENELEAVLNVVFDSAH